MKKMLAKIRHFGKVIALSFFYENPFENNAFFTGQKLL